MQIAGAGSFLLSIPLFITTGFFFSLDPSTVEKPCESVKRADRGKGDLSFRALRAGRGLEVFSQPLFQTFLEFDYGSLD